MMKTHDENMKEINASNYEKYCWYEPGNTGICDTAWVGEDGVPVGSCTNDDLSKLRSRYPKAELWLFNEACSAIDKAQEAVFKRPPVEITRERFIEMLEVLPPENWIREKETESFKLCEHSCGIYTSIFVRVGNKFFEMCGSYAMPHLLILAEVEKAYPMLNMKTGAMYRARHLTCACCGGDAPAYKQWYNRDTGYGCCPSCFKEAVEREGEAEAVSHYGVKGIHHSVNEPDNDGVVGGIPPLVQTGTVETPLGEQLDGGGEVEL